MTEVQSVPGPGSGSVATAGDGNDKVNQLAQDNQVNYVPGEHKFQVTLDGKPTDISPLEAVCLVLQQRYIAMSDVTAQKTKEMQDDINKINEANSWLNAVKSASDDPDSFKPPAGSSNTLTKWMADHGLDTTDIEDSPDQDGVNDAQSRISNYVDQLSSTNDLKMLSLKTAVNKSQEALTAADGVLQDLKQLMQTITGNMAR